LLNCPYRIHSG